MAMSVSGVKIIIKYVVVLAVGPKRGKEGHAMRTSKGCVVYE
jgi:hypothetical protein